MKRGIWVSVLVLMLVSGSIGQQINDTVRSSVITAQRIFVTTSKTTNLIFPSSIKSADRGSADVMAQQVKGIENILQVKAAVKSFSETNLTVITADGKLYSFLVNYHPDPQELNIRFYRDTVVNDSQKATTPPLALSDADKITEIEHFSKMLLRAKASGVIGVKTRNSKMALELLSIFIRHNVMYYQIEIRNKSNIDFDVDMLRLFVKDKKRAKRSAIQAIALRPLYIAGNMSTIPAQSKTRWVIAVQKLTISKAKRLICELREQNGGRDLSISIQNKHILHSQLVKVDK